MTRLRHSLRSLPSAPARAPVLAVVLPAVVAFAPSSHAADAAEATVASSASAASGSDPYTLRPSAMLGMTQWVLFGGGNIAAQVKFGHWVAEYSHGQALQFERLGGLGLTKDERDAGVSVHMPWTTGGGFGYQITPELHVMVELKLHRYEVEDDVGGELSYTTFTVGPGIFYDLYLYKGLFVQPNLRWWPTVASNFDTRRTLTADDGSAYRHERHDLFPFVNVNIGWTFDGT